MNRPPADVFGQALLEDPPQWAELHVVANRRETESLLAWKLSPENQRPNKGKIKRTGVRELAARQRSRNLCLHIGF